MHPLTNTTIKNKKKMLKGMKKKKPIHVRVQSEQQ